VKQYIDISVPVSNDIPVWEGDPKVEIRSAASIAAGDIANVSFLNMGAHTGTHIDAPVHFVQGQKGVDSIAVDRLIGEAVVVDFGDLEGEIHYEDFERMNIPAGTKRLLCKTSNSRLWTLYPNRFYKDFIGVSDSGARWVVEHGIDVLGVDYLGVERFDSVACGAPTHHRLLEAEVIIIEGLNLSAVEPGPYELICLPVRMKNLDGAPCRAILVKEE